jgi:hypothetical protein
MVRLRHASQIHGAEANEVILLNSHDGTSSYQMFAGVFRFVCSNGMVCGEAFNDIRVRHTGNIVDNVIEGACSVLADFELLEAQVDAMKTVLLNLDDRTAFARAALTLRYGARDVPPPITESQLLQMKRRNDANGDLWTTLNCVQENMLSGGLKARSAKGTTTRTRPVTAIDQTVKLNRGLWVLAEEIRMLKS